MPQSSFILITGTDQTCILRYISETITDLLGWEPHELVGQSAYKFIKPSDVPSSERVHTANVMNEKLCSMVGFRFLSKYDGYVMLQSVVHYCYDSIVATNWLYDEGSWAQKQRMNSVDEAFVIKDNGELAVESLGARVMCSSGLEESLCRSLQVSKQWVARQIHHEQEPRFFLILNRYSDQMNISYVSDPVSQVFGTSASYTQSLLGKSLYDMVHVNDRPVVRAQCNAAKAHFVVARIRFDWLIDEQEGSCQQVDTVVIGTSDGLVMVVRLVPKPVQVQPPNDQVTSL